MNKDISFSLFFLILACHVSSSASGSSFEHQAHHEWLNEVELGFILNRGNTRNTHFDSKFTNQFKSHKLTNELAFSALLDLGSDITTKETTKTAQKYKVIDDAALDLTKKWFTFGKIDYTRDLFSSFDYVINESIGMGYYFVQQDNLLFSLQSGPGARHSKVTNFEDNNEFIHEFIWSNTAKFKYRFSDDLSFSQSITADVGQENTKSESLSELKAQFMKKLALKFNFLLEYNTKLPATQKEARHADTTTSVTIVYTF